MKGLLGYAFVLVLVPSIAFEFSDVLNLLGLSFESVPQVIDSVSNMKLSDLHLPKIRSKKEAREHLKKVDRRFKPLTKEQRHAAN